MDEGIDRWMGATKMDERIVYRCVEVGRLIDGQVNE